MIISLQPVLLSQINIDITFYNKLPPSIKNIFNGAYFCNISKAYLTVDNSLSALTCVTFVPKMEYE